MQVSFATCRKVPKDITPKFLEGDISCRPTHYTVLKANFPETIPQCAISHTYSKSSRAFVQNLGPENNSCRKMGSICVGDIYRLCGDIYS